MNKLATLTLIPFLASCAAFSSPTTTLGTLQDAAIAARMTMRPVIDAYCAEEKRRCDQANKVEAAFLTSIGDCPGYEMCHQVRMIVIRTLEAVQFAIADANLALALGNEERFEDAVIRVGELLVEVQNQMQLLNIIPMDEDDGETEE